MDETGQLSALIGEIYDAALDKALWPDVLGKMAEFTGGQAAGLLSKQFGSNLGNVHFTRGVEDDYIERYNETYWRFDPLAPVLFYPAGAIVTAADIATDREWRESRFYSEWLKPQEWLDGTNVVLEKSSESCAILSILRRQEDGYVDNWMHRRVHLLIPHVTRAVLIGKAIELKAAEASTFAEVLDGLSSAMFLAKADGRIAHANAAGEAMLAHSDILYTARGKLTARGAKTNRALLDVLARARQGDGAVGISTVALPLETSEGEDYIAHVLPLTSGARRQAGSAYAADAAIFVRKTTVDTRSQPEAIAQRYGLTPTELRVLLAIVDVGGAPEVAEALGVAQETVKWHLARLYQKTGATRQADLVKLVAGFSNPLLN